MLAISALGRQRWKDPGVLPDSQLSRINKFQSGKRPCVKSKVELSRHYTKANLQSKVLE